MTPTETLKRDACATVDELANHLIDLSHEIHAKPELAFEEHHAVRLLSEAIAAEGVSVTRPAYGIDTAFCAEFGNAGGPRIAILSEYDALPGIGHACGHNIIAAIGLGTAVVLRRLGGGLRGSVRYLGTPAEERGCGKELLARAGAFAGVDAAMMVHPSCIDTKAVRCICLSEAFVTYTGRSTHASVSPELGVNALDAVVTSYQAIAQLRQHIKATERIHGIITNGGSAPNIVPNRGAAHYFVRAANVDDLAALRRRVQACLEAGAKATGCSVEIGWSRGVYLDMKINEPLADAYEANAASLGRGLIPYELLPCGTTDMANVSHRVPALHPLIACAPIPVLIHDPEFAAWAGSESGDKAVLDGVKALAMTAIDFLMDEDLRERTRAAFEATAQASKEAVALAFDPAGVVPASRCGCC